MSNQLAFTVSKRKDTHRVRREPCKVLIFSGCNSHPATGSLQPVAIEATRGGNETVGRVAVDGPAIGDSASRPAVIASERSAGLERSNVVADLAQ